MVKNKNGLVFWVSIFLLVITMGTACSKATSNVADATSSATYVSIMNMAYYCPAIDVYFNDTIVSTGGITPGNYSKQYGGIRPGNYDVKLKKSGSSTVLAEIPSSFYDTLNFYTILLYNTPGDTSLHASKLQDNFQTLSVTSANYRFFNLAANAGAVDLYMNTTTTQTNRTPADNVSNLSYNNFQSLTPGSYDLVVKKAGTSIVLATSNAQSFLSGNVYTIILNGTIDSVSNKLTINVQTASVSTN